MRGRLGGHTTITLVEPLGNVVGMAILGRAQEELKDEDWTLAIVLAAIAVECELVYLFTKWNRVDRLAVVELCPLLCPLQIKIGRNRSQPSGSQ